MTTHQLLFSIVMSIAIIGIFALVIVYGIMMDKEQKKKKAQEKVAFQSEETPHEPQTFSIKVKVTDLRPVTRYKGIKTPTLIKEFFVYFEDEDGNTIKLDVSEENFDAFEKGQKGLLTLNDGQLYSFVLDE